MRISVIIPAHNEEENIPYLIEKLSKVLTDQQIDWEVIFIDDGSTDGTFKLLKSIHEKDPRIKAIKFRRNFGQTTALKAGFDVAKGDLLISMDADLQNSPEDIPRLLSKLNEGYDVVCGWRRHRNDGFSKKIASRISNWLAKRLTDLNIHDFGCTLRLYKRETVKNIELYGEIHRFIPAIIRNRGFKITEIEVAHHPRKYGKSKYGSGRLLKGLADLLLVKFLTTYSTRPMHLFGGLGIVLNVTGVILGAYLIIQKFLFLEELADTPLLLAVILIITGIQFIALGFVSEMITRTYYRSNDTKPYEIECKLD